jgi:hypothetical protein
MKNNLKKIIQLFATFIILYAITLPLWLKVHKHYDHKLTHLSYNVLSYAYDFAILYTTPDKKGTMRIYTVPRYKIKVPNGKDRQMVMNLDMYINTGIITTNTPMSIALFLALILTYARNWKKKVVLFIEGMLFLLLLHFVSNLVAATEHYFEFIRRYNVYMQPYLDRFWIPSNETLTMLRFFFNTFMSRFEPFLLAIFIWFELQRKRL